LSGNICAFPVGVYIAVSAGFLHTCAVTAAGEAFCRGRGTEGQTAVPVGNYSSIAAGGHHSCGVLVNGTLLCWGDDAYQQSSGVDARALFVGVSAGQASTCGITSEGVARCWGSGANNQTSVPVDMRATTRISVGANHTCGVYADGTYWCAGGTGAVGGRGHRRRVRTDRAAVLWKQLVRSIVGPLASILRVFSLAAARVF
jgi:hypothetical protein